MSQWETPYVGTLRVTNRKTLEKWVQNGNYHKQIQRGYIYAVGCGRFRTEPCICHKCKNGRGLLRQQVIDKHYKEGVSRETTNYNINKQLINANQKENSHSSNNAVK